MRYVTSFFTLIALFFTAFTITTAYILFEGFSDKVEKSDVAIILGSKVDKDGLPSIRLKERLNKGVELYKKGVFGHIIVSGGLGAEGFDEAMVMRDYLIQNQIPASVIFMDNQGNNTALTAKNSAALMRSHHFNSALIISQYFHIARAQLALHRYGIKNTYTAHANYFEWRDIYSTAREVFALYKYLFIMRNS